MTKYILSMLFIFTCTLSQAPPVSAMTLQELQNLIFSFCGTFSQQDEPVAAAPTGPAAPAGPIVMYVELNSGKRIALRRGDSINLGNYGDSINLGNDDRPPDYDSINTEHFD